MARRTKAQIEQAQHAEALEREALWFESSINLLDIIEDHMLERGATNEEIEDFWNRAIRHVRDRRVRHWEQAGDFE